MSQYEIYALKYAGPFTRTGAQVMWYQDWDKVETINYYIWCIKGAGETVVVDAGVTPQMAAERELEGYVNPAEVLARINVKADEVRHVIITHMHFDHAGGAGLRRPPFTFRKMNTVSGWGIRSPAARLSNRFQMPSPPPTWRRSKARIAWSCSTAISKYYPASNACCPRGIRSRCKLLP
jgi:hypothetical protein